MAISASVLDHERQGYLDAPPLGIGVAAAHQIPGGCGEQLQILDIETGLIVDHEDVPLAKYLSSASRKLAPEDRVRIIQTLAEVIRSDTEISVLEVDFFNSIADALKATPAELMGITAK